jgi:two-component system, NarL family, nitrate/nitrite response regulator NarL
MTVGVIIVSPVRLYRDGLASVLGTEGAMCIEGTAATSAEVLTKLASGKPTVILVDIGGPQGVETLRDLRRGAPAAKLIALALGDMEDGVLACAEAGISGYVPMDGSLADLRAAVESAMRDELLCSPRVAAAMVRRLSAFAAERNTSDTDASLTAREVEVTRLVARGLSNKDIARELGIGLATVKNHVHHILDKLGLRRRAEIGARMRAREARTPAHHFLRE